MTKKDKIKALKEFTCGNLRAKCAPKNSSKYPELYILNNLDIIVTILLNLSEETVESN